VKGVQGLVLGGAGLDGITLEQQTDAPLAAEHGDQFADDLIEPGDGAQRL